jgi:hypothetical protein
VKRLTSEEEIVVSSLVSVVFKGVNPVRFLSFWPKLRIGTEVPQFLVLGNWNREPSLS